ncbi:hypothetical protein BBJ29_005792 [Phytophthora kernoviae]|uniref:Kinesin motor domain-containing protein n=1 Tax=Phytophthora kernoviae TaxID=325452 RepID=A0A3F2RI73_9STRA|nr:hypothetical protein BBP00_00007644 [Phytophthora kernoviae]RLN58154.1 hypothetical protein BBJ29_005792 [Phytophthora kernoviae]
MMRPHMRIFYLSWMSAITGFFGWYAIPPLMPIIKVNLGLTDGEVLNSDIASTASTIFSRIASGPLLDRFGPQVVQSYVLWLGAIPIICAAFVNSATDLLAVRFFIGLVGCIFVTGQYWTTITFARNVAGTANAFLVIPFVFKALKAGGVSEDMSWRFAIALPAVLMLIAGTVIRFVVDSCPTGDFEELKETKQQAQQTANQQNPSQQAESTGLVNSFKIVLSDKNVLVMIMHYAACFGMELQLNNMGALYFYKEFLKDGCTDSSFCSLLSTTSAATVASSFGLMNMFARALGGSSIRRLLSKMHSLGSCIAFYVLIAIAAQASGGSTYGIVPYLNEQHTGTVNGLVGAGGNFGGAIFGIIFRITSSYNAGMFYMSMFIFACALLTPLLNFSHLQHHADFHAGKVLELGVITAPTQEHEEAYIPVALARAQLSKVVADMHAMKAEQVQKLGEILEHYRGIEKDTRIRHEAHVRALKDRAESRLKESRDRFVELEKAGALREELHTQEKVTLLDEQEQLRQKHLDAHEKWRLNFECALQAHEDEFAKAQALALDEIARVSRVAASTGVQTRQKLCDEMEMCSEDALSQAMRVDEQLHKARSDMQTQHQAFLNREDKLIKTFAANQEVDRFLRTLIDNVVDSRQQHTEEQRSLQLHEKLRALESKAKDAGCREEVLERRLKVARERFEHIESQAVRETVELLVHAVVVTYERFSYKPPATLEMPTQTEEEEVKIEAELKTEEKTAEDIPAVPALPLDKIIYESEVEVIRERNVALIRSKSALQEAKQKLDACAKNKKTAKTAVKIWLSAFQAQHGREPAIEEKAQVKDKYLAFKEAEEAYSAQKTLVATLKQQHHELALRIDASSRWSALGSAVVKSARTESQAEEQIDNVASTPHDLSGRSISEKSSMAIAEAKDDDDEQTEQDQDEEVDDSVEDESQDVKEDAAPAAAIRKQQSLEKKQQKAEQREQEKKSHKKKSAPPQNTDKGSPTAAGGGKALEDAKQKLRALERQAKADRVKISQLEAALAKAENQLASGGGGGGGNAAGGTGSAASDRRVVDMEKKHKKALDESEKAAKKEIASLASQLQAAQRASQTLQEQASALQKELGVVGGKAKQLGQLETEVNELREQAALVAPLNNELREAKVQYATLETSYREEQTLRKKYYNQIEDMKGKIRVYARCRPMSGPELERGCAPCVKFLDEFSLEVSGGSRATKTFAYDQVFSPAISQIQVFEDTKNLLQSAIDGYNVCIFAYGQTGSGKTFTMTGCENDPGLSPRAIHHLFALASESKANFTISFQATMLELYNDTLIDLFHLMEGGGSHDNKLDIKKNEKGMVVVSNATLKKCSSPEQTLRLFEAANKKRQVGATKMNAESSRSHSIFSLLVESFNNTTKTTTIGKLSLVDLAGSERAGKTGATADRLKEAQAINKSLSALGDVISALSTNEKFIPYRNNKLTQLMQDSLGGNAKTLMFVNISPADYNTEETVTSLTYASRVKLITNNANKNSESEQVNRLKAIIKQLRAGKTDVDFDGAID